MESKVWILQQRIGDTNIGWVMSDDPKTLRKEIKWLILGIVLVAIIPIYIIIKISYFDMRVRFLSQYISEDAAFSEIKWTDYYDVDWLKSFSITMTESEAKQMAYSSMGCRGYKQLCSETASYTRRVLKSKIVDCSDYAAEFNIASGVLFIKTILDDCTHQDWERGVEVYNIGWSAYLLWNQRNPAYVKKWAINYQFYKAEWKHYSWKKIF